MVENGSFSNQIKGVALITIGVILLLQKLGIFKRGLDFYVVVFIALYLILIGFMKLDGARKIKKFMKQKDLDQ